MKKGVCFYFDVVSPYSWVGFEKLMQRRRRWEREGTSVSFKPFFLGGVMEASKNKPPATNLVKANWMMKDLSLLGKLHHINFSIPSFFPANTIQAQRVLTALYLEGEGERLEQLARVLWKSYWGGGDKNIADAEVLREIVYEWCQDREETERLMKRSSDAEVKKALLNNTKEAIDEGAFGAPWIVIDGEGGEKVRKTECQRCVCILTV